MGAPGGSYIAPAMAQGIMNVIDFEMSMLEAVAAPRVMGVSNSIDSACSSSRKASATPDPPPA